MKNLTLVLSILFCGSLARAATLAVPRRFATIQAAINAARPHDVIEIAAGTYAEGLLVFHKSFLTLRPRGADRVLVDAGGRAIPLVILGGGTSDILVQGIEFKNSHSLGAWIAECSRVRLERCRFSRAPLEAIRVTHCAEVTIKRCDLVRPGGAGIASFHGGLNAIRNTVRSPGTAGIALVGTRNSVVGNLISAPGDSGIVLGDGVSRTSNTLVQGNEITQAGLHGVECRDVVTGTTIDGNRIERPGKDGIHLAGLAHGNQVTDNHLERCGDTAMEVESDGNHLSGNRIRRPRSEGIRVGPFANRNTFERNRVSRSRGDGFDVRGVHNRFERNWAFHSAGFDLNDHLPPFSNKYINNQFGTVFPMLQ